MKVFENLSSLEKNDLLKFPAYVSMLAANNNDKLDEAEKKISLKLAHTKTFTYAPLLKEFYREADLVYERNIELLDKNLPNEKKRREKVIKKELVHIEKILLI